MSIPKWSLRLLSFAEETRLGEERARRREEERMAEGRKQALLRRKLLILQIGLASPWAIEQMAKGWRPQNSGQGIEEQIVAAQAMIDPKDPNDPVREMVAQGLKDMEDWTP
jgi:hypothetical protein